MQWSSRRDFRTADKYAFTGVEPSRKGPVIAHEHRRNFRRINRCKPLDDHVAGFPFVIGRDFLAAERPRQENRSAKIIAVGCSRE